MSRIIARMYPKAIQKGFAQLLKYCEVKTSLEAFLTRTMISTFLSAIVITLFVRLFSDTNFVLLFVGSFLLAQFTVYAWLSINADSRGRFVEDLLPDLLQLMASNLRAGYTIDKALILSARPEFGHFKDEINRTGKEVATGKDFTDALLDMSSRIKSEKLKKSAQLIAAGHRSGGGLVDLLTESAANLRRQKILDERVRSNVLTYVIFIFAAISFGAPMLFSLSSFLIEVMSDIFSQVDIPETGSVNIPLSFSEVTIDPDFVTKYTIVSMIATSIMGAMIMGLISKGKRKAGFKMIPVLIIISLLLFFMIKGAIGSLLGGLFEI